MKAQPWQIPSDCQIWILCRNPICLCSYMNMQRDCCCNTCTDIAENLQVSSSQLQLNQEQSSENTGSKLLPTSMSFEALGFLFSPRQALRWRNFTAEMCYPLYLQEGLLMLPAGQGALLPGAQGRERVWRLPCATWCSECPECRPH